MQTYKTFSNHTFTASSAQPVEVFTESDLDYIDPGKTVTDLDGKRYTIGAIQLVSGRLFKITLLPLEVSQ